ncbi:hypothetical protein [Modestobacter sp. SYSU DS0875]
MSDPTLVPAGALTGLDIGFSVSDSADLGRLGLTQQHCELAVAELARAVLLAGGNLTYGGRIQPEGFTQILMDEVRRYADGRNALTICLAETEHRKFTDQQLAAIDRRLGTAATLVCLDAEGNEIQVRHRPPTQGSVDPPMALTALRRHIAAHTDARVVVGGQLTGHQGAMPGVIEEALLSLQSGQPIYVAAGFGGAAAAIARALGRDVSDWAPPDLPAGADAASVAVQQLTEVAANAISTEDGLEDAERRQLAVTHRPGDIATLVVLGLARLQGRR